MFPSEGVGVGTLCAERVMTPEDFLTWRCKPLDTSVTRIANSTMDGIQPVLGNMYG